MADREDYEAKAAQLEAEAKEHRDTGRPVQALEAERHAKWLRRYGEQIERSKTT